MMVFVFESQYLRFYGDVPKPGYKERKLRLLNLNNDIWNNTYKSKQGNIGLGQAIAYYTLNGYPIMIPLNDTQKYDLVVDKDNKLYRVSIKTTQFKERSGNYAVQLKNSGGGSKGSKIRNFDNTSCDILFVYTKSGDIYEIPSKDITAKSVITLSSNIYGKYKK